jgi:tRNA-5-taurinomethyluridine 2-sulfurtransferase
VVAHCISEGRAGRTPNPDVLCNSRVKFGAFLEHLEQQKQKTGGNNVEGGNVIKNTWDRIASGHYARIDRSSTVSEPRLALTPDAIKDQTYFLAHLSPAQLANTLFPLGSLTKPQVRSLAVAAALPNKDRKDSQGICFLGKVRFSEFIKEHLGEWPGPIIEEESQLVLGYHQGFWFHTVGQRKGIFLHGGPWYVTRKDPIGNAVYISRQYYEGDAPGRRGEFFCEDFSWTTENYKIDFGKSLQCKVRHGPNLYECTMEVIEEETFEKAEREGDKDSGLIDSTGTESNSNSARGHIHIKKARVVLNGVDQGLAAGQYAVFYQDGYCLGCAVICENEEEKSSKDDECD